ncbi:MAG: hypothetical protein Q9198_000975 [Flavoplaca austrocitrina]
MFQSIKKKYYESKSITKRLLAMRGVKEIKFVKSGTQADGDAIPDEEAAPAVPTVDHDSSGLQNPDLSCYIFLRTPKKIGEPLIADDRATPEAWVCSMLFFVKILAATPFSLMLEKLSGILSDTCKISVKGTKTTQLSYNDVLILL